MFEKTTILFFAGISPLCAQGVLDPLLVTATRSEQAESTAPYTADSLDSVFLRDHSPRTLPDALQYIPGVLVQKTAHGHGSPFIRGFTGRQNLLLVDGVRVNNSTFRGGPIQYWNTVDSLAIDHIEVIKSQGSVLYGSDAVGGTVNAFTKSSGFRDETAGRAYAGGSAFYEYRANGGGSHISRLESETGVGGKFGVLLGVSAKDYGDIEDSAVGRMHNTGYPEQNLDFRLDWAATPESTLTFASNYVNQDDISRWHRTLDNPGWTDGSHVAAPGKWTENTYDQERSLTYLRYTGKNPQANAPVKRWSATLSFQATDDSEFQNRLPDSLATNSRVLRGSSIDVETTGIDLVLESPVGPGSLVYGFDFYHDDVNSSGYTSNALGGPRAEVLPVADDSDYDLFGVYSQYVFKPTDRFELTAGARYTHAEATLGRFAGGDDESRDWDDVVGSLRGIYSLNDGWSVYGRISQAFRAPNIEDLSGNSVAKANTTLMGNLDLNPEKYITYELGARQQTETTSLNLAVFYTAADELIVSSYTDNTQKTSIASNAGDGYVYGVELEGAWQFHPQWMLTGFAAWQEGRTESATFVGGPVEDKPNTADNQRIPTGGTPGYVVASLRAGWHATDNLDLTCGIENLSDESYRVHGSGQNEAGLSGIFGVKVGW